jgi:hypothetical protein
MADKEPVADEVEDKPELSIREELQASLEDVQSRQEKDDVVRNDLSEGQRAESDSRAEGRARGPDGKFARAEPDSGREVQPTAATAPQPVQSRGQPGVGSTQPVALPAPNGWKAEEKALWAKVPAEVQHVINRREQEAHRAITSQDEVRLVGNNFMQAANEYAPLIQARGGNPVALFREFLGIIHQIQNSDPANRANLFRQLAAQNGADLRQLGFPGQPNAPGPQQPNIPIDQLVQRRVNEAFQARQRQDTEARERAEMQATNGEIESFRSKVDASGQPAYPYFDHVTSLMASILGGGVASTLEEAYQLAVKAHPETSALVAQAEQAKARKVEEQRRKVETKRRAAGSIRGGPGSASQPNGKDRSIRDELTAAFEEARGRV